MATTVKISSSGHKVGQIIGDWWEVFVLFPLLQEVGRELNLFVDNRSIKRECRTDKLIWPDDDGNEVDYDFVFELGGSVATRGIPVAFFESFWRKGARHSKDKARDDTNKLLPMKATYPTARFLAIAACGEFTEPARDYVRSRSVELLFVHKQYIVSAFEKHGLMIDYPDDMSEESKSEIARQLIDNFYGNEGKVAETLLSIIGKEVFSAFKQRVKGALQAVPQEIIIQSVRKSTPQIFRNLEDVSNFLRNPSFEFDESDENFTYSVVYSDGSDFYRQLNNIKEVIKLHDNLSALVTHFVE